MEHFSRCVSGHDPRPHGFPPFAMFKGAPRRGQGKRGRDKKQRTRRTNAEIQRDNAKKQKIVQQKEAARQPLPTKAPSIDLITPPPSPVVDLTSPAPPAKVESIDLTSPATQSAAPRAAAAPRRPKPVAEAPVFIRARGGVAPPLPTGRARPASTVNDIKAKKSKAGVASGAARRAASKEKKMRELETFMVGPLCRCHYPSIRRETYVDGYTPGAPYWGCVKGRGADGGCGFYRPRGDREPAAPRHIKGLAPDG